jgi:hypothetical protein
VIGGDPGKAEDEDDDEEEEGPSLIGFWSLLHSFAPSRLLRGYASH